jgi:hypothetical protein
VIWQNGNSNADAIRHVLSLKDLLQEGSSQMLQKVYETEFHVQGRFQTGVWERAEFKYILCRRACPKNTEPQHFSQAGGDDTLSDSLGSLGMSGNSDL